MGAAEFVIPWITLPCICIHHINEHNMQSARKSFHFLDGFHAECVFVAIQAKAPHYFWLQKHPYLNFWLWNYQNSKFDKFI